MTGTRKTALRRALCLTLVLCLLFSLTPGFALAAESTDPEPNAESEELPAPDEAVPEEPLPTAEEPAPSEEPAAENDAAETAADEEAAPIAESDPAAEAEPEGEPAAESDSETANDADSPSEDEAESEAEGDAPETEVSLRFVLSPETAELTLFERDDEGQLCPIEPLEDGSYRLLPGLYVYTLCAEGYEPLEEQELLLEASDGPVEIRLSLSEAEELEENVPVLFLLRPRAAELTVLPAGSDAEAAPILPGEDGSFSLVPGDYLYTLRAEGYVPAENVPFAVEPSDEPLRIEIALDAVIEEYSAFFDYVNALAALNLAYGLTDDRIPAEQFDGGCDDPYLTRRLIVSAPDGLERGHAAARVLRRGAEYVLQYETEEETRSAYERLRALGAYESVVRDAVASRTPDLPGAASMRLSSFADGQHYSWGIAAMGLDVLETQLLNSGAALPYVTVAVVDSGVNAANGQLAGRLLAGYNVYDGNTDVTEEVLHGTSVAGVVVDGTPSNVMILPVKVTGENGKAPLSIVKAGIQYALEQGVDVINLSMGFKTDDSSYLETLFAQAQNAGVVVCVSAGNDGADASGYYPARSPLVITIAAVDEEMQRSYYSNYGAVDFALPGTDICTTAGDGMDYVSGTSFSCPHAAAAAALLKSTNKGLGASAIRSIFIEYSVPLEASLGYGFIDLSSYLIPEPEEADPVESFVRRCYTQILGRRADDDGVAYWAEQLRSRRETGASVVNGFLTSDEYLARGMSPEETVKILYRVMMGRAADEDGTNYWVGVLHAGVSNTYLVNGFASAQEFIEICRGYEIIPGAVHLFEARDRNVNVTAFVSRCYRLMLEREPDVAGLNDWCALLLAGYRSGASLVDSFFVSEEFQNRGLSREELVNILYRTMLNREADDSGRSDWVGLLDDGVSGHYIINGFAAAPEFVAICGQYGITAGAPDTLEWRDRNLGVTRFVSRCYAVALEREGEADGLNDWCRKLLSRALTPRQVAEQFVFSAECVGRELNNRDFVTLLYRLYMGREPDAAGLGDWLGHLDSGRMTRRQVSAAFAASPEFTEIVRSYGL